MVKFKKKYCENCKKDTTHEYIGKDIYSLLPLWFKKYYKCSICGEIHEQDTAHLETHYN